MLDYIYFGGHLQTLNKNRNSSILSFLCLPGMPCLSPRCDFGVHSIATVGPLEPHLLHCNQRACCILQSGADRHGGVGVSAYHFLTQKTLPVSFLHLLACLHLGWRGLAEFIASPWTGPLYHSQGLSLCSLRCLTWSFPEATIISVCCGTGQCFIHGA